MSRCNHARVIITGSDSRSSACYWQTSCSNSKRRVEQALTK
ncbi:hypothetical protein PAMC26510_25435 [Caballeronia sordidicola]|uniref:Uncharacterized protein n=1 Tax=Caballeronia sordidicola TaxID=196367 RepID=A0A242MGI2_CABSO|nr:hypothetical protein PAMC26510_25435 [Caballeronia sordidicola]